MNEKMEEVVNVVTSCLLTSKRGTTIDKLNKDYRTLTDTHIPYHDLGYPTLEAFLRRIPSVKLVKRGLEIWVEAIPTRESAHIARLVAGQKQSTNRRRPLRSRQVAPARRPQAMSRNSPNYDTNQSRYRSSNGTGNSYNRGSSNNSGSHGHQTNNPPRPLMQQPARPPLMSLPTSPPSQPRYTGVAATQMASPSTRMLDRNIQPHQHLDYARNSGIPARSSSSPIFTPETSSPRESPQAIRNQQPPRRETPLRPITPVTTINPPSTMTPLATTTPPLTPITPGSAVLRPVGTFPTNPEPLRNVFAIHDSQPVAAVPTVSQPVHQPTARTRLCDRLVIPQNQNSFGSTVTNGNGGIQVTFANTSSETPITPISPSQDPRDDLSKLLRDLNLGEPEYKTSPVVTKKGVGSGFYGQVLFGSSKFSSYPEEARTETEAEMLAARRAFAEIMNERGSKIPLVKTCDRNLIKDRVLSIVDDHVGGVFTHKIPDYYQKLHKESLPDDWLQDVAKWTEVEANQGVDKSTILSRRRCFGDKFPALPSPKTDKVLLNPIGRVEPGKLEPPDEPFWIVHVPTVISSVEIWVRLVGEDYSDQFDKLTQEMCDHYAAADNSVSENIEIEGYYALKEGDIWHRVRVIGTDESTSEADVFFIDIGVEDTVTTKSLFKLDKKFCSLAAQATRVALAFLEDFSDCSSVVPRIEKTLLDRTFYAEVLSRENTDDGPTATVVFHDTNGPDDINVNELISKKILQQLLTNVPQLEIEGHVTEVHISHVEKNGDVFVQVKYEGMKFLVKMLNKLTENGLTVEELRKSEFATIDRTKIYFAKCPTSGVWYRSRIIDVEDCPKRSLKLFMIDFGRTMTVETSNILQLDVLSPFLARYPAQAMKVRLHNLESSTFGDKMVARLVELAAPNEVLISKVVRPSCRGSPPTVELFKRLQPDNVLVAINNTLALEPELSKTNGDGNNNVRPRKRLERTNSRISGESEEIAKSLKPPPIAGIGEYFDVHVTMAANPGNFTVQPYAMKAALSTMMGNLQTACAAHVGPHASLESIREGRLYAAKHVDGHWYRVCVSNVINEHMVTVYFCDYGDVTVITLDKLQRLQKQFLELPYQAIKAKLVGIQPTNKDWAVEDAIRFQDLVVERDFVSVVVESAPDKHFPGETVLGLNLIDVSTTIDVNLGKLLVDEGRATYTDL